MIQYNHLTTKLIFFSKVKKHKIEIPVLLKEKLNCQHINGIHVSPLSQVDYIGLHTYDFRVLIEANHDVVETCLIVVLSCSFRL